MRNFTEFNTLRKTASKAASSKLSRRTFLRSTAMAASAAAIGLPRQARASTIQVNRPLRFGANYVPSSNWFYSWPTTEWNIDLINADLKAIANLGFDHIRVQCIWPFFMPTASNVVADTMKTNLSALLDSAYSYGLGVQVTVLDGWMAGAAYLPSWSQNVFTDTTTTIPAEELLLERLLQWQGVTYTIGNHPAFLGFDIGNEMNALLNQGSSATAAQVDTWQNTIWDYMESSAIQALMTSGKAHVLGIGSRPWWQNNNFTRTDAGTLFDRTVIHYYPSDIDAIQTWGDLGTQTCAMLEYNAQLAYAYHTDLTRPVWVEETGLTTSTLTEISDAPSYINNLVENAAYTGVLWGITWWCSHNFDPGSVVPTTPPLLVTPTTPGGSFPAVPTGTGATMGLLYSANDPSGKEVNTPTSFGEAMATVIGNYKGQYFTSNNRSTALVVPDSTGLDNPNSNGFDLTWANAYMNILLTYLGDNNNDPGNKNGFSRPCILLESQSGNTSYLADRGITQQVSLSEASSLSNL
jgi:hypothetical protein